MPTTPDFWGREPGALADLLLPLGMVWETVGRARRALARAYLPPVPVVCVGNLVVGGAGKTPVTIALARWFAARGLVAHVVTRGYGGRLCGPCRIDPLVHDAGAVGDEALLLAATAPSWVARSRAAGAAAAAAAGAQVILLDDGFQNPTIGKTLSAVVVDIGYGFGNRRVMPAGPLRENLRRGLARADAVVLFASEGDCRSAVAPQLEIGRPVIPAMLAPLAGGRFAGRRVFAFAGIARPSRFFASLRSVGAQIVGARRFPDHYRFRARDIEFLFEAARRENARLVTTAKDFVRLPPAARAEVDVLEVEVRWPAPDALARMLAPIMLSAAANAHPERSPT
jgi:tetraacyldisaccharide 4'-kinase